MVAPQITTSLQYIRYGRNNSPPEEVTEEADGAIHIDRPEDVFHLEGFIEADGRLTRSLEVSSTLRSRNPREFVFTVSTVCWQLAGRILSPG